MHALKIYIPGLRKTGLSLQGESNTATVERLKSLAAKHKRAKEIIERDWL